jgi:c-di-GMP-binding flagellar brake protein YcgR
MGMTMPPEIMERLRESVEAARSPAKGEHRHGDGRVALGTTVTVTVTPVDSMASRSFMRMRVADFSGGGVGLLFGESISIGSEVMIHLPGRRDADGNGSGDRAITHNLRCLVCNCRSVADGVFRVGVQFEGLEK